ncbi:MAG: adenosine kinase [Actinobacteria bacterium]|nr:adenosine kinase [Actinomycetota bacterium]
MINTSWTMDGDSSLTRERKEQTNHPGQATNAHLSRTDHFDVISLGSAIVDIIVTINRNAVERLGLAKGQMTLVDAARTRELLAALEPGVKSCGGSAANTAIGLASLGAASAFMGKIASDNMGTLFTQSMKAHEVTFFPVVAQNEFTQSSSPATTADSRNVATGTCIVLATPDGDRTMATNLGVASTLQQNDINVDPVLSSRVFYVEAYLWDIPPARTAIKNAMAAARQSGTKVALSLSDKSCVSRHRSELLQVLAGHVDLLFGNEEEFTTLYAVSDITSAAQEAAAQGITAALTRGAKGSLVVSPAGQIFEVDAVPAGAVVDTTGAGDLYAAGFLYGFTHGMTLVDSARLGSVCATETVSHLGSTPREDLQLLAREAGLV